ncbi:unnamed protein product, partial [Prorocentrum cordatum]
AGGRTFGAPPGARGGTALAAMQRACEMVQALMKPEVALQRTPYHPLCVQILQLLQKEGLIRGFNVEGNRLSILLKHYQGAPVIRNIRVVSKPSRDIWLLPHELKFRTLGFFGLRSDSPRRRSAWCGTH